MALVPFGELRSDTPDYGNQGATVADGVVPRTPDSYGPLADLTAYSSALIARAQGGFACRDSSGTTHNFAADATKLYKLSSGTYADVSGTAYSTATDESVRFTNYGPNVLSTNYADPIQSYVIGSSSTFGNLASAAPKARDIAIIREFVMVANTNDGTDGAQPGRVWWSAVGDPTSWPTPGTASAQAVQSDFQDLPNGGWAQRVIGAIGGADGAVIMESSIYRIAYDGPGTVFRFDEVEKAVGTPAPGSVVNVGNMAFYLGEDGFRAFDGTQSIRIGENKVDKTFWNAVNQNALHRISSAVDPINKLVFWSYCADSDTPNKLMIFNYGIGRFSTADMDMELIWRTLAEGRTLESLDSISASLDELPYSLDSRFWTGNRPLLAAFDTEHKLSFFSGDNLAATMETGEFDGGNGQRVYVDGIRPFVDGGISTGGVTAAVGYRDAPDGTLAYTTATSVGANGICPQRINTRYARARVSVPAAESWDHAMGIEPVVRPAGKR